MVDLKILAAVFTALTAIAVFTGGAADSGSLELENAQNLLSPDILGGLTNSMETRPVPENSVEANLTVEDLDSKEINLRNSTLKDLDIGTLEMPDRNLTSNDTIDITQFEGTVSPGNMTEIAGHAKGISTSGIKIDGFTGIEQEVKIDRIKIRDVNRTDLSYSNVTGKIRTDSLSTDIESSRNIEITSFSGDITVYPGTDRMVLDGKVHSLKSGEFGIGG